MTMNWAITLIIDDNQVIERRLETIVSQIIKANEIVQFVIYDIDATGQLGNQLTEKINERLGPLRINQKDVLTLVSEEGQILELDLRVKSTFEFRFIIRDGGSIDILGDGERLPLNIVGEYKDLDINIFL